MRRVLLTGACVLLIGLALPASGAFGVAGSAWHRAPASGIGFGPQVLARLARARGLAPRPARSRPRASGFFRDPVAPTVGAGGNPVSVAVDRGTNTVYVGNGNDDTLSVIDGSTCNATITSGCGQSAPTVAAGPGPVYLLLDRSSHTLYVTDVGSDTLTMVDVSACNAQNTSGCGATPATVVVGNSPDGLALNESTHTLYVANGADNTVSVVDTATCNAEDSSGCATVPTITVGGGPAVPALNPATHTLYVPNSADNTLSVIDVSACDAEDSSGCGETPAAIAVGPNPFQAIVDQKTDTVYEITAPAGDQTNLGSVVVINGARCNGHVMTGCGIAAQVTVGSIPIAIFEDASTRNVYVGNEEDSSVSIIDAARCNATHLSGCKQASLTVSVAHDTAAQVDVNPLTHTLYVPSQDDNDVSVLDTGACSDRHQQGCRVAAPVTTVGTGPQGAAANPATNTIYVGNRTDSTLSVIDGSKCNATNRSRCGHAWPTVATGDGPQAVAVNSLTDTVYTANSGVEFFGGDTVSVVDGSTCNSHVTTGCNKAPASVTVGDEPVALAVDQATNTIYVGVAGADFNGDTVAVIDGATCNGTNHSGCATPAATVTVGHTPGSLAVDEATDTIYVVDSRDGTVSMIDGSTCNGANQSGCSQTPPSFATDSPNGVAVEQATNTVYVGNFFQSVSVIDGATCNADDQSGCAPVGTLVTPDFVTSLTVDQHTGGVFVDRNFYGSQVWAFDGTRCNARTTTGCGQAPVEIPVGGWPGDLAVNPATGTIYVPDNTDGRVSLFGYARAVAFP